MFPKERRWPINLISANVTDLPYLLAFPQRKEKEQKNNEGLRYP
jgi:hypothetical protein